MSPFRSSDWASGPRGPSTFPRRPAGAHHVRRGDGRRRNRSSPLEFFLHHIFAAETKGPRRLPCASRTFSPVADHQHAPLVFPRPWRGAPQCRAPSGRSAFGSTPQVHNQLEPVSSNLTKCAFLMTSEALAEFIKARTSTNLRALCLCSCRFFRAIASPTLRPSKAHVWRAVPHHGCARADLQDSWVFRSGNLVLAISSTCLRVNLADF